ncbi:uncharacterized protein AB675_780 [Cyphellophora attinorum]|uniref:Uncharacterized protein n=1 Tax=Cyphellophora attinorum TaxID=1664694 RepID=A0A0N1HBH2_9EURO|nr:uncharacterized protein AB675_780 [Phialophora attinorum]KPI45970.1 hypothetical protein AB675_780 [Phialophora attinorum]
MCPIGEDHPGHDYQEVNELGLHNSRGPNMMIGSKSSKPTMMVYTAFNLTNDLGGGDATRRRRSGKYDDDDNYSDEDEYNGSRGLVRRGQMQVMLRSKEDDLVERALERIRRARALGKTNVKLTQAEIDALERSDLGPNPPRMPPMPLIAPKPQAQPKSKKAVPVKQKAIEAKKKGTKSSSNSPKPKPKGSRSRGQSAASDRSRSSAQDEALIPYPITPDDVPQRPGYFGRQAPNALQQEARGQYPPAMQQGPYSYYAHHYSHPDVLYGNRPLSASSRGRPDPAEDQDWQPRARSTSSLVNYPIDQLPQQAVAGTRRAPRFDPSDPRYASPPSRRVVSGPAQTMARRQQDEMFLLQGQPDVRQYQVDSGSNDDPISISSEDDEEEEDSDESSQGVQVNVEERGAGSYAIQTRSGTRANGGGSGSSSKAVAKRRR